MNATAPPPADRFAVRRAQVRDGVEIAYVREGEGGFPLVLLHGWPETKRIWWRNIEPLAAAGFEVIVPDLRGFGDSGLAPDGFYDPAAHARDVHALVHDVLGHERCATAGGDVGGVVVAGPRPALRRLRRAPVPVQHGAAHPARATTQQRGHPAEVPREVRMAADYFLRQGREADALAAELDTPEKRRRYIAQFYGSRFWAAPGTFRGADVDFMTEPFADADKLRAGFGDLRDRARHPARRRAAAPVRDAARCRRCCSTAPRTTSSRATSPPAARSRSPSASGRSSCRAPATSCSGSGRTC